MIDLKLAEREVTAAWSWPIYTRDRRTIAFHEAGHLVLSLVFKLTPDRQRAEIHANGGGVCTRLDDAGDATGKAGGTIDQLPEPCGADDGWRRQCLDWSAMYLGGHAAELVLHGLHRQVTGWPEPLLHLSGMSKPDIQNAMATVSFAWPTQRHAGALFLAWRHAVATLREHWPWVAAVGREIHEQGACTSERAHELRARHGKAEERQ